MASSTTIPRPSKNANNTIMFIEKPIPDKTIKAINIDNGTDKPTNIALVAPIKNMRMMVTKINPMMMVLIKSCSVMRVSFDWSPVKVTFNAFGKELACISSTISRILSEEAIKFSPPFLTIFKVITFSPLWRPKLSCSLCESATSAISRKYTGEPLPELITKFPSFSTSVKSAVILTERLIPFTVMLPAEEVLFSLLTAC